MLPAICALACQSCGIYSFSGTSIQPDIQTFTIEYMQYKALRVNPTLSNDLTEALTDQFRRFTKLEQVDMDGDLVIAGEITGQSSHITGTLYIILSAHRSDSHCRASEVSGHKCQICQPFYHIHCLRELTYSHTVKDHSRLSSSVESCGFTDLLCRNMSNRLRIFRSIFFDHFYEFIIPFGMFFNKCIIRKTLTPDHICHSIYKGKVRAAL